MSYVKYMERLEESYSRTLYPQKEEITQFLGGMFCPKSRAQRITTPQIGIKLNNNEKLLNLSIIVIIAILLHFT